MPVVKYLNIIIEYGILLFIFLIPYQGRLILSEGSINGMYWEYGTRSLYLTEALLFIVLLALAARGAAYLIKIRPRPNVCCLCSPAGAVFLLIAFSGISVFWSIDPNAAFERWIVLIEASAVFLILSSGIAPLKKICWAVILSGFVQACFGISQFLLQEVSGSAWLGMSSQHGWISGASVVETELRRWLRAYGSFPHPNILGGWLVLSLSLIYAHLLNRKFLIFNFKFLNIFLLPIFTIILFGLLASFSRSAWLAFFLASIFYLLFSIIKKNDWFVPIKILLVSISVIAVFSILFWEPMSVRIGLRGRLEAKSNSERIFSLQEGWRIIKTHPVLGVGIGNYGLAVHNEIDSSRQAWFYQPVHNVPMLICAELGIIGILLITYYLLLITFHVVWKEAFIHNVIFLAPILVISLFDHYLWSLYPGMMISAVYFAIFWLMLGKDNYFGKTFE